MTTSLISATIGALLWTATCVANAQQAFKTADEAASALVSAAKSGDLKGIVAVLGPDGEDIVSSGDASPMLRHEKFVAAYEAKHQIEMEGDDKATMVIGQDDFPVPIPLVRKRLEITLAMTDLSARQRHARVLIG